MHRITAEFYIIEIYIYNHIIQLQINFIIFANGKLNANI